MTDLGSDIHGVTDLDASLSFVSGRRCLQEALARRIMAPLGALIDDPNWGVGIGDAIGEPQTSPAVLEMRIERQCLEDERVLECDATVTVNDATSEVTVTVSVTDADGTFALVLTPDQLTTETLST